MQSHCGYLSNDDSSESIGSGSIDTYQFHLEQLLIIFDDLYLQVLFESGIIEDWLLGIFDDLFLLEL
jgi:hypothetical protein